DRYVSAAEKISRAAVGRPTRSPGGETIRVPAEVTQEEHLEGLPIGTRGGALVHYTFPLDGEYEIQVRLMRDRDEQVEGLSEPHVVEILLDKARVQMFTVKPPVREPGVPDVEQPSHEKVDQHVKARLRVAAGPHDVGATFPKKPSVLLETARQPYQTHFNYYRHPPIPPPANPARGGPGDDRRPVHSARSGRYAEPPQDLRVASGRRRTGGGVGEEDSVGADPQGLPAPGGRGGSGGADAAVSRGTGGERFRRRHRGGAVRPGRQSRGSL